MLLQHSSLLEQAVSGASSLVHPEPLSRCWSSVSHGMNVLTAWLGAIKEERDERQIVKTGEKEQQILCSSPPDGFRK